MVKQAQKVNQKKLLSKEQKNKKIEKKQKKPTKESNNQENEKNNHIQGKQWSQLQIKLRQQILFSLMKSGFSSMFPVQEAAIPLLLKNYDVAVQAQTGSGKTLSFIVPLLEKLLKIQNIDSEQENNEPNIKVNFLLISPTRQLCQQSFSVLTKMISNLPDQTRAEKLLQYCHCVTGGNDVQTDFDKINGKCIILMGTVGRIREISEKMEENWLKKIEHLFIDEADRVLKEKGIEQLIKKIQKIRRTAMFSATLQNLQQKHYQFFGMRNLAKISLKPVAKQISKQLQEHKQKQIESDAVKLKENAYIIPKNLYNTYLVKQNRLQKIIFLINFIQKHILTSKIIVFFNTCSSVDFYTKLMKFYFTKNHQAIEGVHGKLKSKRRSNIIKSFLGKQFGVLFATDVVSRGIDFDEIHFIIQIDPPENPDNYVHRIGRTARINKPGTAILLIQAHEEAFINFLEQKSVGVKLIQSQSHFIGDKTTDVSTIRQRIFQIMVSDRDFIEKSKKAFVSFIRSYKEHDLKYIFEFKNLQIGSTAYSFFLLRIPRIKQILGKNIKFEQTDYDIESIRWKDKNQARQYNKKKEKRDQQKALTERKSKKFDVDIKNNKSKRKRVRNKNQMKEINELNKQHRQILKRKKLGKNWDLEDLDDFAEEEDSKEDTQEIEKRITGKLHKK